MSKADRLHQEFARKFPESFARLLARGDPADAVELLDQLPPDLAAPVAARLSPRAVNAMLATGQGRPDVWLSAASFDDAAALLGDLPRERRISLINGMKNKPLRRRLLQFINYPTHTVGAIVSDAMITFGADTPVVDVLIELRTSAREHEVPLVVLDGSGRYSGVLEPWQLLVRDPPAGSAGDYASAMPTLRPESPLSSAVHSPQWQMHNWLPVVDHEGRVLGTVTRRRITESRIGADRAVLGMQDSIADVALGLMNVMSELLGKIVARRAGS